MLDAFALAVQMVTGVSLLAQAPSRTAARRSVAWFPLVGALVGIFLASVWTLAAHLWRGQPLVAAALTLAAGALLTGGRPLGGVARSVDGLAAHGAGGDRSRAFAVMRDPRRGTTGLVALGVALALKLAFLAALPSDAARPLVLACTLGRWAGAFALCAFPLASASASDAHAGRGLADAGPNEFLAATALAVACAAVLPGRGLPTLLGVALLVGPLAAGVNRRLGGFSGPLSQALGEVGEIAALACLAL